MLKFPLKTPKKGDGGVVPTAPPTPVREVPFLRLPSRFGTNRDFPLYTEKSNVVVITNDADDQLLEEVCALNEDSIPKVDKVLFRHENLLLLECNRESDSDLHEACAEYLMDGLREHSKHLERLTGFPHLLKLHGAKKRKRGHVPDVLCKQFWIQGKHNLVNVIAEISYGVPLNLTHPRIANYFDLYPTLRTALIIRIDYDWRKYPAGHEHEDFFDISDGKMVLFRYDHPHFDRPSLAISFGNDPITNADVATFVRDTHIDIDNVVGFGVGEAPSCVARDIPLYQVVIDRDILFVDHHNEGGNPAEAVLPMSMIDSLIDALGENADALDFNIDLFLLKRAAIEHGIDSMNEEIEEDVGRARPEILDPVL